MICCSAWLIYPIELRTRVVTAYQAGDGSYAMLAQQFAVGSATVKRWVRQHRREGHVHPKPKAGGARSTVAGVELEHLIIVLADPTAGELTAAYNRTRRGRQQVHMSSIKRALQRHDYVVKKTLPAAGSGPAGRPRRRRRFLNAVRRPPARSPGVPR